MARFLEYLFNGLSDGSIYGLLGLGLVVVYRGTGHLNLAQGEMAMFSTFIVWQVWDVGVPFWAAIVVGIVFGALISGFTQFALVGPISKTSPNAVFVVLIGLFLALDSLASAIWGGLPTKSIPSVFPNGPTDFINAFGAILQWESLGEFLVAVVLVLALIIFLSRTQFGLAMRAVASSPASSRLVGIRTDAILVTSWALAGALGAVCGILVGGLVGQVTTGMMFDYFVYATAAATLGGFDSIGGVLLSGWLIGVLGAIGTGYAPGWIGDEMQLSLALVAIFAVLLIKPSGFFGLVKVERV